MINVLIVEDDPMVALINKRYLEQIGEINIFGPVMYEEDVIKVLTEEKIDLILMDLYLPKKNGIDIVKSLRNKKFLVDVIMITAGNNIEEINKAMAYGVLDYLVKPFEFERFERAISKYKLKKNIMSKGNTLCQNDIDDMLIRSEDEDREELPKGLNKRTLDKIIEFLKKNSGKEWTLREIAYEIKISNVTIKKYMDYLEEGKKVDVYATSGNVGRPELKYSLKF